MSFFKNTTEPSDSEDSQSHHRPRDTPSPTAVEENSGNDCPPVAGAVGIRFVGGAGDGLESLARSALWTETLGYESLDERMDCCGSGAMAAESSSTESRSRKAMSSLPRSEKPKRRDFPPILSTLMNSNGRTRFNLRNVMENGRLMIYVDRNERPDIVRISRSEGRLKIEMERGEEDEGKREKR